MPKLNVIHLPERLQKRIEQLERDEALEARDINALLTKEQQQALKDAWQQQKDLRTIHNPPKTEEKKRLIGWKTIREVRLEIYRQALQEAQDGLVDGLEKLQHQREVKAAKIYLDAYFGAKEGTSKESAGKIELQRAGFYVPGTRSLSKRDKEVRDLEDRLRQKMEDEMNAEEKEQLELSREYEKAVAKRRK